MGDARKLVDLSKRHDAVKPEGFLEFYARTFPSNVSNMMEIGVFKGGSIKMWRDY